MNIETTVDRLEPIHYIFIDFHGFVIFHIRSRQYTSNVLILRTPRKHNYKLGKLRHVVNKKQLQLQKVAGIYLGTYLLVVSTRYMYYSYT